LINLFSFKMDLITKIKNQDIPNKIYLSFDDDQLRFLFIIILLIGAILMLSGVKYAVLFLVFGFGILAFLVIFVQPKKIELQEDFICDSLFKIIEEEKEYSHEEVQVTFIENNIENCQIKFRNSLRNKN
jgi:hypothetical protein